MTKLEFQDLEFAKEENKIQIRFYKHFRFNLEREDLDKIGVSVIGNNFLVFDCAEKTARNKWNRLMERGFKALIGPNNRPTTYVHKNSGIPLIGTNHFGIIDRDTDILEVKPMTGCNLNCVFCSVDEGVQSRKTHDFVVEEEYLASVFEEVAAKKQYPVEAHIAGQNEPLLYPRLKELIMDINSTGTTKDISIDTNGVLLTKPLVDELAEAGLTRVNLSLNSLNPELAKRMAGTAYDLDHIVDMARYVNEKIKLLIAPVLVPGMNEEEMPKLIKLAKDLGCIIGIQNFLEYDKGRRPAKQYTWTKFYKLLDEWAEKYDLTLRMEKIFMIETDKVLEKPFKKGDKIQGKVVCPGKYPNEWLCTAKERVVSVETSGVKPGQDIRLQIVREKHNIYKARKGWQRNH